MKFQDTKNIEKAQTHSLEEISDRSFWTLRTQLAAHRHLCVCQVGACVILLKSSPCLVVQCQSSFYLKCFY